MWRVRHPKLYRLPGTGGRCGQLIIRQGPRLFHLQELKGVGRSCLPSGQELKAGGYTGETGPERPRRQTAEADERKRTGEEQTDKNRRAKYSRQMLIISDIRVPLVFCMVELYSQLAGNTFPIKWEHLGKKKLSATGLLFMGFIRSRRKKGTTPPTSVNERAVGKDAAPSFKNA